MSNGVRAILDVSRAVQALALTKESLKVAKKKKVKTKDITKLGFKNIVGINLIKMQKDIASTL